MSRAGKSKSLEHPFGVRRVCRKTGKLLAPKGLRRELRAKFYNRPRRVFLEDVTDGELEILGLAGSR
jgi:hypothetical protein